MAKIDRIKQDRVLEPFKPGEQKIVKPLQAMHKGENPHKLQPFRVQLMVQDSVIDAKPRKVVYYVRGPRKAPDVAAMMADQLWQKWEKFEMGKVGEYPDTRGYGFAELVDEDDFQKAWREVKKYQLDARVAGDQEDPMAFTCIGRTDI
jgi:hypothetical protein